jgi:outer membrane protein assembly factor BamA
VRTWRGALAALVLCAPWLSAQRVWRSSLYPYLSYSAMDGIWIGGHYGLSSPIGFVERAEQHSAALSLDAGGSLQGSYRITGDVQAPALWAGWRVGLTLVAARDNRLGFYGIGNTTPYTSDSVAGAAYFYRVSRTHAMARATVQRRIVGPLRLLAGASVSRTNFRALPGRSVFRQALGGAVDTSLIPLTDKAIRAGLVVDTRDNELDPHAGFVLEALFASGTGYTRTTAGARVFVHPLTPVVLAARLAGEGMGGNPPLAAQIEMESSERPFIAVGGYHSLRGFYDARFIGPGKLVGGFEVRLVPLLAPSVVELLIVGFYDAGRVFAPGERFRVTTADLHQSGGAEVAIRFLRNALIVAGVGRGSEGTEVLFGTRWSD